MRDLLGRAAIGIALAATVVMAVGYAYVFSAIGTPPAGDVGTFDVPADGTAVPVLLNDGQPAWVATLDGEAVVLDARAPRADGSPAVLLAWCEAEGAFLDLVEGRPFDMRGRPLAGSDGGLVVYRTRTAEDDARIIVESSSSEVTGGPATAREVECPARGIALHRADEGEIFDPSVALEQEPPGWIWLEGTLTAVNDEARLCDGLGGGCDSWAAAGGIDPANLRETRGRFIGRVRDGAIAGLIIVPDLGESL